MKLYNFVFAILFSSIILAQDSSYVEQEISINGLFKGTLIMPEIEKPPIAIILAGSGPLDKDGNTNFLKGNMLKKLAEQLAENGIASFRYDKYSLRRIKKGNYTLDYIFDAFVEDAKASLEYFNSKTQFGNIYIIGHSQGSLVGMLAAPFGADGFISIAGPGNPIDKVITDQIKSSSPGLTEDTKRVFEILKSGKTTKDFPAPLASIFNIETQPFIMSWMNYNPQESIKELDIPILIINGTKDIQVAETEAQLLQQAVPYSKLQIIEKMNHALVIIEGDRLENVKSYNEPNRPLSQELVTAIVDFIK